MALPLPKVVADTGAGGGLVTALGGINSLQNDMMLKKINEVKAQYAPLTTQADAASKMAYANLMGPQFLAKLMGNDSALANMSEDQKRQALSMLYRAGSGQGTGNALMMGSPQQGGGNPFASAPQQQNSNLSGWLSDKMKNIFSGGQQNSAPQQQQPSQNALAPQNVNLSGMVPGQSYTNNSGAPQTVSFQGQGADSGMSYDQNGNNVIGSPSSVSAPSAPQPQTYAENTGAYKGVVEEGQEAGKIRAKDIDELNTTVFNAETHQATLDDISSILASPEFEQIRQVPLLGHHELSFYSKEGTPAQQNMVGRYYTDTGNVIKDSARDFAGQFRKGEQQLLQGMKPNPSDTVDTARGKLESLSYFNKMLSERSKLTSKIMSQYHVNKLQASEAADKQINGEQIRQGIHDKLNPTVTIKNKRTGETKTISAAEARALGVPNV